MKADANNRIVERLLFGVLIVSFVRFSLFIYGILKEILQVDFSTFYLAGKVLNRGMSLYENPILYDLSLWDGVAKFKSSGFLYPPLAAVIFQPLALMPYFWAKILWTSLIIICTSISVWIYYDIARKSLSEKKWLITGICILNFFPLLANVEKGQIDALCMLLIALGLRALIGGRRQPFLAGVFFSIAVLFKLYCGLLFVFLFLRKEKKAMLGMMSGGAVLVALMIMIFGWVEVRDYVQVQLPRISKYIFMGPQSEAVDPILLRLNAGEKDKSVQVHGESYVVSIDYNYWAGFPVFLKICYGGEMSIGTWGVIASAIFIFIVVFVDWRMGMLFRSLGREEAFLYWMMCLAAILLSGPITWVMNGIWLLPLIPYCVDRMEKIRGTAIGKGLAILAAGLFVVGYPDESSMIGSIKEISMLYFIKTIIGNLTCFVGLLMMYQASLSSREGSGKSAEPAGAFND